MKRGCSIIQARLNDKDVKLSLLHNAKSDLADDMMLKLPYEESGLFGDDDYEWIDEIVFVECRWCSPA